MSDLVPCEKGHRRVRRPADSRALVFGRSMIPHLAPLTEVAVHRVTRDELRSGDVLAFARGGDTLLRRVIFISRSRTVILIKGDNRPYPEILGPGDEIIGIVEGSSSPAGRPDSPTLHRIMFPWVWCFLLAAGLDPPPPGFTTRRWISSLVAVLKRFAKTFGPSDSPVPARAHLRRRIEDRGFQIRSFCGADAPRFVDLWNQCFPSLPLDASHLERRIRASPWFSDSGLLLAVHGNEMAGFALSSERRGSSGEQAHPGAGFIECLGVHPQHRRKGIGSRLLSEASDYLRSKGCHRRRVGPFMVAYDADGRLALEPSLQFFGKLGYSLSAPAQLMDVDLSGPAGFKTAIADRLVGHLQEQNVEIRLARTADMPELERFLREGGARVHEVTPAGPSASRSPAAHLIGLVEGKIMGSCRQIFRDDCSTYDQFDWIWDATVAPERCNVGFLYVHPECRHVGLGAALVAQALANMGSLGARKVWGQTSLPALRSRYERWGGQVTHMVFQVTLDGG